jgi:hypothetical protein
VEDAGKRYSSSTGLNHPLIRYKGDGEGLRQYDKPGHVEEQVIDDMASWIKSQADVKQISVDVH